jgi:hypothetical protein
MKKKREKKNLEIVLSFLSTLKKIKNAEQNQTKNTPNQTTKIKISAENNSQWPFRSFLLLSKDESFTPPTKARNIVENNFWRFFKSSAFLLTMILNNRIWIEQK